MKNPDLTNLADVTHELSNAYAQAFHDPVAHLERLYEMAKRDQWNAASLPWEEIDFTGVPSELRNALASLYTQTHYGELGALMCTAKAAERAPLLSAKMFGATQVMDEARHVEWFTRLMRKIDARAPVQDSVAQLVSEIYASETAEEFLVGMQIVVEGAAQTLFVEGGRLVKAVNTDEPAFAPLRGLTTVVGDWLVNYVGRDESRHVAFGVLYVAQQIKEMSPKRVAALNKKAERWSELTLSSVRDRLADMALVGLDGDALLEKCRNDQNDRFRSAGIEARAVSPSTVRPPKAHVRAA
jgi:hypothetical protein